MTAPYERVYVPQAVGQNRDRVKKIEGMDTLPATADPVYPDPTTAEYITEDDGSSPTGYVSTGSLYLLQEGVVNAGVAVLAIGGWGPGTGTEFWFGLSVTPDAFWASAAAPIGYGVSIDSVGGAQTPIYFEVVTATPFPVAGFVYARAVVWATGAPVGPGVPYAWVTGDTIWKGVLTYGVTWPETAP
jgi:hypothetical protein